MTVINKMKILILRPQIIQVYVKNEAMQKIAREYGMNMIEMQRNFYKEIAKQVDEDWIHTDAQQRDIPISPYQRLSTG